MTDSRVAIITGAGRGIGAATAISLSAAGWRVCLVDVCTDDPALGYKLATRQELDDVAARCGADALPIEADVRQAGAIRDAVSAAVDAFGHIDAAVAAAGAIAGGPNTWETPADLWAAMIDINLTGVLHLASAAIPAMLEQPEPRTGRFVAVASAAAHVGLPQLAAYTAAKHGVAGLIKSLAAELGPTGITANAVSPGSTATPMLDASAAVYGLDSAAAFADQSRIERLIEPAEIASAIAWLCSRDASAITGAIVPVDGGFGA